MTTRKRAGSRVAWLHLSTQWAGPKYPTQDAEPLVVLCNVQAPLIDTMTKWNPTLKKTSNLENARNSWALGYLLDTTKLNGGQQICRSVTQFSCIQHILLTNLDNTCVHSDILRIRARGTPRKQYIERILMRVSRPTRCRIATESAQKTLQSANQSRSTGSQCHVGIQP